MRKALIADALIYGGVDFLWKFINFALFPLLAYLLSVEEFGVYTLLNVATWLTVMVINCGLHVSLEKFYLSPNSNDHEKKQIVSTSLIWLSSCGTLLVGGGLILSYIARNLFVQIEWKLFAIALATSLPMSIFHYLCNVCRVSFCPWKFSLLHFLQNSCALIVGLSLVFFFHQGVAGLLWGSLLSFAFLLPLAFFLVVPSLRFTFHSPLAKTLLLFGMPFLFNDLARWTYSWLDRFWLEQLATLEEVGLYGMAFKLATPLIFLITAFSLAWTPYALKEVKNREAFLQKSLLSWLAFLTFCATGISLFAGDLLRWLTPFPFWGAAPLVPPIAAGLVFLGSNQVTQVVLMHDNKTEKIALLAWLGGLINCFCNFLLIPFWGGLGAALSLSLTYLFIGVGTYMFARKTFFFHDGRLGSCLILTCIGCYGGFFLEALEVKIGLLAFIGLGALYLSQNLFSLSNSLHTARRSFR